MADMLYKATKYMNAEDTMIARGASQRRGKGKRITVRTEEGSQPGRMTEGMIGGWDLHPTGRSTSRY